MLDKEILNLNNAVIKNERIGAIITNVMIVQKCNFNDEYYIESREISIEEIKDKPLIYFDAYLNRNKNKMIKIAVAYIDEDEFKVIVDEDGFKKVESVIIYSDLILTDDFNDTTFIASKTGLKSKIK